MTKNDSLNYFYNILKSKWVAECLQTSSENRKVMFR